MRDQVLALLERHLPGPFRPSGANQVLTKCPFHKGGEERKPSFSINLESGIWHCFTCHEPGSEHSKDGGTLRQLLRKLQIPDSTLDAELKIIEPFLERKQKANRVERRNFFNDRDPFLSETVIGDSLLGVYHFCPTKLVNDGFSPALLEEYEIGYDRDANRIMYPVRDMYGNLAGFVGGVTELTQQQEPKYKVYQSRRFDEVRKQWIPGDYSIRFDQMYPEYQFENHNFLWNFHKVYQRFQTVSDPNATVFVVEGFKACLWMIQSGFINTVALMGTSISDRQQRMLHRLGCTVALFLDNDRAGINATFRVGDLLWRPMYGRVQVVPYPAEDFDTQPDDYETDAVHTIVGRRQSFPDYLKEKSR